MSWRGSLDYGFAQTRPALVPLVLDVQDRSDYCDLTGVSAEVVVSTDR